MCLQNIIEIRINLDENFGIYYKTRKKTAFFCKCKYARDFSKLAFFYARNTVKFAFVSCFTMHMQNNADKSQRNAKTRKFTYELPCMHISILNVYMLPGICRIRVSVDTLKFQGICRYPKQFRVSVDTLKLFRVSTDTLKFGFKQFYRYPEMVYWIPWHVSFM